VKPLLGGSAFHHCGARTENSWDFAERCLPVPSEGGTSRLAEVVERSSRAGALGSECLEVGRGSSAAVPTSRGFTPT